MEISFLIVTKNRPDDLALTLNKLKGMIDLSIHEVLVLIDGCPKTEPLVSKFDSVNWTVNKISMSASPARNVLYAKAKGNIFIGLDDDAHPISDNFIAQVENEFNQNKKLGIIAFQEVRGLYESDDAAIEKAIEGESYFTGDFVGCGFAIRKDIYDATNGFPLWMDIYGEESAVALEVLDMDYEIMYQPSILVNHRIDLEKRKVQGRNYFRFERQLKNSFRFFLVYYKKPTLNILKLLVHNFRKYAIKDFTYFKSFMKVVFSSLFGISKILKYRSPVKNNTIEKRISLKDLKY